MLTPLPNPSSILFSSVVVKVIVICISFRVSVPFQKLAWGGWPLRILILVQLLFLK